MEPDTITLIGMWISIVGMILWQSNRHESSIKALDTKFDTKIDTKFDALNTKIDTRIDALDTKFDTKIDTKFDALDTKIDTKIDALDTKFDTRIDALNTKMDGEFKAVRRDIAAQGVRLGRIEGHLLGPQSFGDPGTGDAAAPGEPPPEEQ